MRSRILLAVVVLGAIVAWARCSFNPQQAIAPALNQFFAGCFAGAIDDVALVGEVTVVLEAPADPADTLTLGGCMQTKIEPQGAVLFSLAGSVEDVHEQATVTAMPNGGGASFTLSIVRRPDGDENATEIDVTNAGGAPFQQAANLPECNPQLTCPLMAAAMKPLPEPVLTLP